MGSDLSEDFGIWTWGGSELEPTLCKLEGTVLFERQLCFSLRPLEHSMKQQERDPRENEACHKGLITCGHPLLAPHLCKARVERSGGLLITAYLTPESNNFSFHVSAEPNLAESERSLSFRFAACVQPWFKL